MPKFTQIELFLAGGYADEERKRFLFQSRCICNYLERKLAKKAFESTYSRVNIHCTKDDGEVRVAPLKGCPYLEVRLRYDVPPLADLDEASLQQHYAQIIDSGLTAAAGVMEVPHDFCMRALDELKKGGFRNTWIQAEKSWARQEVRCEVIADLTTSEFTLTQRIYRGESLLAERLVAQTLPREMLFLESLGTLSMNSSGSVVYKKRDKVLTTFNLASNCFEG